MKNLRCGHCGYRPTGLPWSVEKYLWIAHIYAKMAYLRLRHLWFFAVVWKYEVELCCLYFAESAIIRLDAWKMRRKK